MEENILENDLHVVNYLFSWIETLVEKGRKLDILGYKEDSTAHWRCCHYLIFNVNVSEKIVELFEKTDIEFEYYNFVGRHKDDVLAYYEALKKMVAKIEIERERVREYILKLKNIKNIFGEYIFLTIKDLKNIVIDKTVIKNNHEFYNPGNNILFTHTPLTEWITVVKDSRCIGHFKSRYQWFIEDCSFFLDTLFEEL